MLLIIFREAKTRFQAIRTSSEPLLCTRPRLMLPSGYRRCDKVWLDVEFEVSKNTESPSLMALESLIAGFYGKTTTCGAATCLIGCLDEKGTKVGFANIGDSRAMILRYYHNNTNRYDSGNTTAHTRMHADMQALVFQYMCFMIVDNCVLHCVWIFLLFCILFVILY